MEYDVSRAHILLRDLERMAQKHGPGVELVTQTGDQPAITGRCTRSGLLRLAVHLARAALVADARVIVGESGWVGSEMTGGVMELWLADDPPTPLVRRSKVFDLWRSLQHAAVAIGLFGLVCLFWFSALVGFVLIFRRVLGLPA
jgi:hypothetical protein